MPRVSAFLSVFLLLGSAPGQSTLGVPAPFSTIQSAILAASPGDIVLVQPGVHAGPIDFLGKAITIRSAAGAAATTIDAAGGGTVVSFVNGETSAAVLDGFTVINGQGMTPGSAGGIEVIQASPVIRRCVVTACLGAPGLDAIGYGGIGGPGGIRLESSGAHLDRLLVTGNIGGVGGTALGCDPFFSVALGGVGGAGGVQLRFPMSTCVLDGVEVSANLGGRGGAVACSSGMLTGGSGGPGGIGLIATAGDSLTLIRCRLKSNIGGDGELSPGGQVGGDGGAGGFETRVLGASASHPTLTLETTTVAANQGGAGPSGGRGGCGGMWVLGAHLVMRSSTVAANTAGTTITFGIGGVVAGGLQGVSTLLEDSILWGNAGFGSIADLFVSGQNVVATHCNIGTHNGLTGTGNSTADPLLASPQTGDFHLSAASPCRDSGAGAGTTSVFDCDGDPRVVGPAIDRGSDEYDDLIGTREDLVLSLAVDGAVPGSIPVAAATAGQVVAVGLGSPEGTFAVHPVYLVGEFWFPPFAPFSPPGFPEIHVSGAVTILAGLPGIGGGGTSLLAIVPPGLTGLRFRLQAFAPHGGGLNGFFAATAARDLAF